MCAAFLQACTSVATSADGLYVATGGADGLVVVRNLLIEDDAVLRLHDSVSGGVAGLVLAHARTPDGLALQLLSAGRDGVLYAASVLTPAASTVESSTSSRPQAWRMFLSSSTCPT